MYQAVKLTNSRLTAQLVLKTYDEVVALRLEVSGAANSSAEGGRKRGVVLEF